MTVAPNTPAASTSDRKYADGHSAKIGRTMVTNGQRISHTTACEATSRMRANSSTGPDAGAPANARVIAVTTIVTAVARTIIGVHATRSARACRDTSFARDNDTPAK